MIRGRRVLLALLVSHACLLMMCQGGGEVETVGMMVGESNKGGDRATKSLIPKRQDRLRRLNKGYGHAHGTGKGHHGDGSNAGGSGCGHGGNGWGHQDPDIPNNGNGSVGSGAPGGLLPVCTYTLDPKTDCLTPLGKAGECTRQNFGYDCAYCTRFCPAEYRIPMSYELPSYDLGYYGTNVKSEHGCEIRNQVPDSTPASLLDVTDLGNFCCQACFLWRETNTNTCPFLFNNNQAQCWVNKDLGAMGAVAGNNPYVRRTDTDQPLNAFSHFLMIPDRSITGVEDRLRNTYDVWSGAWRVYISPNSQLSRQGTTGPFWSQVNTFPTFRNTGMGVNMANARSQHQMHIHYAPLPTPLRNFLINGPGFPNPETQCKRLTLPPVAGRPSITFGAYFFDKPFGTAGQTWNPRDMAAGCDVWNDVFQQFPPNGIGNLWTRTDLAMASTSMMVVAANPNDASNGYYLLFGNLANNNRFRAEDMLCTPAAFRKGFWTKADCP